MKDPSAKVILVLPVYNEEQHIGDVVKNSLPHVDEIIVVDDGSRDRSLEKARDAGALTLRHALNLGKAGALKTGAEAAIRRRADLIVFMDSDGQHRPEDIPHFVDMLQRDQADLVVGSRARDASMPLVRRVGNEVLYQLMKFLFGTPIHDIQSGFRAFKASHYPLLKWNSNGYHADAEITALAGKHGLRCREIEIQTIYFDAHKGMTILDGFGLLFNLLIWKFSP